MGGPLSQDHQGDAFFPDHSARSRDYILVVSNLPRQEFLYVGIEVRNATDPDDTECRLCRLSDAKIGEKAY